MRDIESFIDDISEKFGYTEILKDDLKRIVPIMLSGKDETKSKMLLDALSETKIFVLPDDAQMEDLEKCKDEIFGKDNKDVTFKETDMGEYSKDSLPDGAYVSEPVFDDNMNIVGRNRMLYVKELSKYSALNQVYGSNINLSHLIHELGHAWAAQTDEYVQNADGSIAQNIGPCSITARVDRETRTVTGDAVDGLFIEETLNTIQEEKVILELTGAKSIAELAAKGYVRSAYQGMQTEIMKTYVDKFGEAVFEEYRYSKDLSVLAGLEQALRNTKAWEILGTQEYIGRKKTQIAQIENLKKCTGEPATEAIAKIGGLFEKYSDVYFPANDQFTPIQKLNNVLEQLYDFNSVKYNFAIMDNDDNLEIYKTVVSAIVSEANALRVQAQDIVMPESKDFMGNLKAKLQPQKEADEYYASVDKKETIEKTIDREK